MLALSQGKKTIGMMNGVLYCADLFSALSIVFRLT